MQAKRPFIVLAALLSAQLAACAGGSGSSGFITAGLENQLIDQAFERGACVQGEGLTICPSDSDDGAAPEPGTPGPDAPEADIDTTLGGANSLDCIVGTPGTACSSTFSFRPRGLPSETVYRVAVRSADPLGTWMLAEPPLDARGVFTAVFRVPEGATRIQIVILAFAEPQAVTTDTVLETLSASGADLAFVVAPVAVTVPSM